MKKAMPILLCAVMLITALSLPAIAAEGEQPANETEQAADEAIQPEPAADVPEPAAQSAVEAEQTVPPTDEPAQTATPTSAPEQTAAPTDTPEQTAAPTDPPEPTAAPTDEPEQTVAPTDPPASPTPDASLLTGAETSAGSPAMSKLEEQMARQSAIDSYKEQIESLKEEISLVWDKMIMPLRELENETTWQRLTGDDRPAIPDEIIAFMEERGIPYFIPGQYEEDGYERPQDYLNKTLNSLAAYELSLNDELGALSKKMLDQIDGIAPPVSAESVPQETQPPQPTEEPKPSQPPRSYYMEQVNAYWTIIQARNVELGQVQEHIQALRYESVSAKVLQRPWELPTSTRLFMAQRRVTYYHYYSDPDGGMEKNINNLEAYQKQLKNEIQTMTLRMNEAQAAYDNYNSMRGGSLFSTGGATATGAYALAALSAFVGGAGGAALTWAVIRRKGKGGKGDVRE